MNSSLLSYADALQILEAHIVPVESKRVSWRHGLGGTLAQSVFACENLPAFDNSAVDGFAVHSSDIQSATSESPVTLPIVGEIFAGSPIPDFPLTRNTAIKIMTGAPIPPGADAVVMVENTIPEECQVKILSQVRPLENIRKQGDEIKSGELLLSEGNRIGPAEIGLLASQGISRIDARFYPQVALMTSGDELVDPDSPIQAGQIRNANSYTLAAELKTLDCPTVDLGIVRDDPSMIRQCIETALTQAQVLITCGGVSAGEKDYIPHILKEMGVHIFFHRLNIKPGKPILFGILDKKLIFGLPGNVVSVLSTFHLFVKPALRFLTGRKDWQNPVIFVRMARLIHNPGNRTFFVRCKLSPTPTGLPLAIPFEKQGSGMLTSIQQADGFAVIPSDLKTVEEFDVLEFIPLKSD